MPPAQAACSGYMIVRLAKLSLNLKCADAVGVDDTVGLVAANGDKVKSVLDHAAVSV